MGQHVVAIGTFDGVHLGHRAILDRVRQTAANRGGDRIAYVFERPPRMVLAPTAGVGLLLPLDARVKLLRGLVDRVVLARFSEIRDLSPETFARDIVVEELRAASVIVGANFRFGRNRSGDVDALRAAGDGFGFDVQAVPSLIFGDLPVSSTRVRGLLADGRIREASRLLGRPPILIGSVVRGERSNVQTGFPTIDLNIAPEILLPADGVYLAHVFVDVEPTRSLLYVGARPNEREADRRCTIHLLSPHTEDLHGRNIEVQLLERLRDDRAAPSPNARSEQIALDITEAHDRFASHQPSPGPIGG